jgi:hypothetical protein
MTKKRMFSLAIVESDAFLDMPLSTQGLYFHLSMNADDYGFVGPKRIMRMVGANDDDLKILIAKRYVLGFDSGVVVMKHWHLNNTVRKDRSTDTTYDKEFKTLTYNEFGAYTERRNSRRTIKSPLIELQQSEVLESEKVENGNQMSTQIRLDKIRLDKISKDNSAAKATQRVDSKKIDGMFEYWKSEVGYAVTAKLKQNREACSKLLKDYKSEEIAQMIKAAALASEDRYAPGVSNFVDLYRKWDQLKLWGKKKMTMSNVEVIS